MKPVLALLPLILLGCSMDSTSLKTIAAHPEAYADKAVTVAGTVTKVCQGMGCWVEVTADGKSVIAKSLKHEVLFPKDCVGKTVRVDGTVRLNPEHKCEHKGGDHECPTPPFLIEIKSATVP